MVEGVVPRQKPGEAFQMYGEIFKNLPLGLAVWQLENTSGPPSLRLLAVNRAASDAVGWTMERHVGKTMAESFPATAETGMPEICREVVLGRAAKDLGEILSGDEQLAEAVYRVLAFPLPERCVGMVFEPVSKPPRFGGETTGEGKPENHAEEDFRQMSARLIEVQDAEQRRIGRELHDSTSQLLTGLAMNLSTMNQGAAALNPGMQRMLSESMALVEQVSRQIRTIAYLLHPPLLEERGLAAALRIYVEGFAEHSGIQVHLKLPPKMGAIPSRVELALFRIVQECLANIHRHSKSRTAQIWMSWDSREVCLEVRDEGQGIAPELLESFPGPGLGLQSMRERVDQLGGRLQIQSSSSGTLIEVVFPLS